MRSLYSSRNTWLHHVPAWIKLAALSVTGTMLVLLDTLPRLTAAASIVLLLFFSLGPSGWRLWRMLRGIVIVAALISGFHWFMGHPAVGVISALRLVAAPLLALMLTVTTRFEDLLSVLETILSPLRRVRVPVERIALSIGLTLRFAENFFAQWQRLDDAHRARTGRSGGLRLLAPLAVRALQTAERVADALTVRLGN